MSHSVHCELPYEISGGYWPLFGRLALDRQTNSPETTQHTLITKSGISVAGAAGGSRRFLTVSLCIRAVCIDGDSAHNR
jgi:hypothetical protein